MAEFDIIKTSLENLKKGSLLTKSCYQRITDKYTIIG